MRMRKKEKHCDTNMLRAMSEEEETRRANSLETIFGIATGPHSMRLGGHVLVTQKQD